MVKVLVLNPVSTSVWDRITLEALEDIASPQTKITVKSLREGVESIETEYDRDINAKYVVEEVVNAERRIRCCSYKLL